MHWNSHSNLAGQHSVLSPSSPAWLRYEVEDLERAWTRSQAAARGSEEHDLAAKCIRLGVRLEPIKRTLNMYVNDAIAMGMTPEQVVFFSSNAFGTVDAINFAQKMLSVWDLKTGRTKASFDQLLIYVAYFCLEYNMGRVDGIDNIDLRIYQGNAVKKLSPSRTDILPIIDRIVHFDKLITEWRMEGLAWRQQMTSI